MNKVVNGFKLVTLGTCLTLALMTGVMSTPANASSDTDEIRAAQAAKIGLRQAITIASKKASGILVSAEFDDDDSDAVGNGGVYELEFSDGTTEYEIKVDAMTAEVVKIDKDRADSSDINDYNRQRGVKISVMAVVNAIERQTDSQVLEVEFKNDRDYADHPTYYEVEMLRGKQIIELKIDAETGKEFFRKVKK